MNLERWKIAAMIGVAAGALGGFLVERQRFPVEYRICDAALTNCKTLAHFHDLDSCETHKRMSEWHCNSTDPENITCAAGDGTSKVRSYCDP
jgi:hypothetical protein